MQRRPASFESCLVLFLAAATLIACPSFPSAPPDTPGSPRSPSSTGTPPPATTPRALLDATALLAQQSPEPLHHHDNQSLATRYRMAFDVSPAGDTIAVGRLDGGIHLLDRSGQLRATHQGGSQAITALRYLDEERLLFAEKDGRLGRLDLRDGTVLRSRVYHSSRIRQIERDDAATLVLSIDVNGNALRWDTESLTAEPFVVRQWSDQGALISPDLDLHYWISSDGEWVASTDLHWTSFHVRDRAGELVFQLEYVVEFRDVTFVIDPRDGPSAQPPRVELLVGKSAYSDEGGFFERILYDLRSGEELSRSQTFASRAHFAHYTHGGTGLVLIDHEYGGTDEPSGYAIKHISLARPHSSGLGTSVVWPEVETLRLEAIRSDIALGGEPPYYFIDLTDGRVLGRPTNSEVARPFQNREAILGLPDGRWAFGGPRLLLWTPEQETFGSLGIASERLFSVDDDIISIGSPSLRINPDTKTLAVFELPDDAGRAPRELPRHDQFLQAEDETILSWERHSDLSFADGSSVGLPSWLATLSRSGRLLAIAYRSSLTLFDLHHQALSQILLPGYATNLGFSTDDARLALVVEGGDVLVFSVEELQKNALAHQIIPGRFLRESSAQAPGEPQQEIRAQGAEAFARIDGRQVLVTRNGDELSAFHSPSAAPVSAAALSKTGRLLAIACSEGIVNVFDLDSGDLIDDFAAIGKPVVLLFSSDDQLTWAAEERFGSVVSTRVISETPAENGFLWRHNWRFHAPTAAFALGDAILLHHSDRLALIDRWTGIILATEEDVEEVLGVEGDTILIRNRHSELEELTIRSGAQR